MHQPFAVLGRHAHILLRIEGLLVEGNRVRRAFHGQVRCCYLHAHLILRADAVFCVHAAAPLACKSCRSS
jgi:hypothetical protein